MNRIATVTSSGSSVTIPSGVTSITLTPVNSSGANVGNSFITTVVPNTTYVVTIRSSSYSINNANTFGSLYSWTASGYIRVDWIE